MDGKRTGVIVIVGGMVVVGCAANKAAPVRDARTGAAMGGMVSPEARASAIASRSDELAQVVRQMPGSTTADDRRLAARAFDASAGALSLIGGSDPPGALRQSIHVIDNTRDFLQSGRTDVPPGPSIDTGLRAIQDALRNLRDRIFPDNRKLDPSLQALAGHIHELDTVRGPTHALVSAEAFAAASDAIAVMSNELKARNAPAATTVPKPHG